MLFEVKMAGGLKVFGAVIAACIALLGALGVVCAANQGGPVAAVVNGATSDSARQLRINKEMLLHGSDAEMRVDAAVELLVRGDRESVGVLLEALVSKDNAAGRSAVCRGLVKSRAWADKIPSRKEFKAPLLGMLVDEEGADARLAGEALLIFEFAEVSPDLKRYARSEELDRYVRLNAIYALKLWSDKEAISELLDLVDDADEVVASAAQKALQESFGIPEGVDREMLKGIVDDLMWKRPIEIIRDLMVVQRERMAEQQQQMARLKEQMDRWKQRYLAVLDGEYEFADEAGKAAILGDKLGSDLGPVRVWALGKVLHYSGGISADLRGRLLGLISDDDRSVRLETAKVLLNMSALNPGDRLLEQLKTEKDPEVALAILGALGEACYYAFSAGSEIELSPAVRDQTLLIARDYLASDDQGKVRAGAEVIGKLVELKGLDEDQTARYLDLLTARYERAEGDGESVRVRLVNVMARLCGPKSSCRGIAGKRFVKIFRGGIDDGGDDGVRLGSAQGLVNINRSEALSEFKERGLADDAAGSVRKLVIELAGDVGDSRDLDWLSGKLGSNGDSAPAWEAMKLILSRQSGQAMFEWAGRIAESGINGQRERVLLELAEKKATADKDSVLVADARDRLMEVYLGAGDSEKVAHLVGRCLREQDLGLDDSLAVRIDGYLGSEETRGEQKTGLLKALGDIEVDTTTGERPKWIEVVRQWQANNEVSQGSGEPGKPEDGSGPDAEAGEESKSEAAPGT